MKTPICVFDAKTGSLCTNCENKLVSGQITQDDVEVSIKLTKIAEKNNDINKFTLSSSKKIGQDYIILLKASDIIILRNRPDLRKLIEKEFDANIWYIESESTDRRFIEHLFYPHRIKNMNLIWLPDGTKITKVLIKKDKEVEERIEKIKKIAKGIRGIDLITEVE